MTPGNRAIEDVLAAIEEHEAEIENADGRPVSAATELEYDTSFVPADAPVIVW